MHGSTYAQVAVPDLYGAVLAGGGDEFSVTAVRAAGGRHFLALQRARLEHSLVLLLRAQVPRPHRAENRLGLLLALKSDIHLTLAHIFTFKTLLFKENKREDFFYIVNTNIFMLIKIQLL